MPHLPEFHTSCTVRPEEGKEDKIDLSLNDWVVVTDDYGSLYENVLDYLAAPPMSVRSNSTNFGAYGWMFGTRHGNELIVRKRELSGIVAPNNRPLLFGGKCQTSSSRTSRGIESQVSLNLSLNAHRYVRYQRIPRPMPLVDDPGSWGAPNLFLPIREPDTQGEESLDASNNWLPDNGAYHAWTLPDRWRNHVARYIMAVKTAFSNELHRATRAQALIIPTERLTLQRVEVAWEFRDKDPTLRVFTLKPYLDAYRASPIEVQEFARERRERNSLSIFRTIETGVSVRIYAKTNRRIRFEVIFDNINHRRLLREMPRPRGTPPRENSIPDILRCLDALRQSAATHINALLAFLNRQCHPAPSQVSPLVFIILVTNAIGEQECSLTLLSLLLQSGILAPQSEGSMLFAGIQRLKNACLICYDATRQGYVVSPQYEGCIATLRELERLRSPVATPHRTRDRPVAN